MQHSRVQSFRRIFSRHSHSLSDNIRRYLRLRPFWGRTDENPKRNRQKVTRLGVRRGVLLLLLLLLLRVACFRTLFFPPARRRRRRVGMRTENREA